MRNKVLWALSGLVAVAATTIAIASTIAHATVRAYPSPGSHFASAQTQISLRNVRPSHIGPMEIDGSVSGRHGGRLVAHSDGRGASFVPDEPFTAGETVTVRTRLPIYGAHDGDYRIRIATPAGALTPMPLAAPSLTGSGVQTFHSRHDLIPMRVAATLRRGAAPGDVFLGKFNAPLERGSGQNGPMILDPQGHLVWFGPIAAPNTIATDVRVQRYEGQPVLTWWQGVINLGNGSGQGMILDRSYRQVATVRAGNGYHADLHEFLVTPRNTALVLALDPVVGDLSAFHGPRRATILDNVVQEIDIKTGLVLMEWHSLDQVSPAESYVAANANPLADDYFHLNSAELEPDGSLIVSARNTWAIYKVDTRTGTVAWRLGGRRSSFRMLRGSAFAWQHDARVHADGTLTLFDDGSSPAVHSESRGLTLRLDMRRRRASVVHDWRHSPKVLANSQGNTQIQPNGNAFIGWGSERYASEYDVHGGLVADYAFPFGSESYRAYRFPWDAQPATKPAVAASTDGSSVRVYMSWNGATNVASWDVLAGPGSASLSVIGSARRRDFETLATVRTTFPFVAVRAKDAAGHVLATSAAIRPHR